MNLAHSTAKSSPCLQLCIFLYTKLHFFQTIYAFSPIVYVFIYFYTLWHQQCNRLLSYKDVKTS